MSLLGVDNYSRSPVPKQERLPAFWMINTTNAVYNTMPVYAAAGVAVFQLGFVGGVFVIWFGLTLAALLAMITARIGAETGLTTTNINLATFGRKGSLGPNLVIGLGALGWYAITLGIFANALDQVMQAVFAVDLPVAVYIVGASVSKLFIVLLGFKAIDRFNRVAVPVLIGFLFWLARDAVDLSSPSSLISSLGALASYEGAREIALPTVLAIMIGSVIAGPCAMPETMRYARSGPSGVLIGGVSFAAVIPSILVVSALPVVLNNSDDFVGNMLADPFGFAAVVVLVAATYTTNVLNIYIAALTMVRMAPRFSEARTRWFELAAIALVGVAGMVMALAGAAENYLDFFIMISVAFPPVAGVYAVHYYVKWKKTGAGFDLESLPAFRLRAVGAWALGSGVAYFTQYADASLSRIPAVDGVACAALAYGALVAPVGPYLKKLKGVRL